jgi:hypothetical protein
MLYTVVATPRSGSTSLCELLAAQYNAENLGEVYFPSHRKITPSLFKVKTQELIHSAMYKNTVVKILLSENEYMSKDVIRSLLGNSEKIFYCVRLDHAAQVKSILAGQQTKKYNRRTQTDTPVTIYLDGNTVEVQGDRLIKCLRMQGQWYKEFPGELCILDDWGNEPYHNTYNFVISKSTKEFLNPSIKSYIDREFDVLSEFYKGDSTIV